MTDIKEIIEKVDSTVGELRKTHEELEAKIAKGEGGQSELKSAMEKMNADIDKQEEENQKLVAQIGEAQKKEAEFKERMDEMEANVIKLRSAKGESGSREEYTRECKALKAFAQDNKKELSQFSEAEQKSYLRSDNNVDGGFLMAESFDEQILKPITETSVLRPYCRTKRVDALSEKFAYRSNLVTSYWTGEGETMTESNSKYEQPEIHVHSITSKTSITNTALNGARFNMESEIMADIAEDRALKEGTAFVLGDTNKKPQGFMDTSGGVSTLTSSTAATYTFDDLILLTGKLETGYSPMYGFNRTEGAFMRTLKDGASAYIWRSGNLGAGIPNAINGYSYIEIPDMVDKGSLTKPVIFADFAKMYCIADAFTAIMLRNPYKVDGKVQFSMESWVGGGVLIPEAGHILQCKTS